MNPLSNLERIERFVTKQMDASELASFKQELASSPQLQEELKQYKDLIKGLKHRSWKIKAQKAYESYQLLKALKLLVIGSAMGLLAALSYFVIQPDETYEATETPIATPSAEPATDTSWHLPNEVFLIDTKKETVIETENGTIIAIQKNAFVKEDGSPTDGQVDFKITEAFDPLDIMKVGLSTTSNGELLETAGMLNLEASQDGIPVTLDPNKPLLFDVPTATKNRNMLVFDGEYTEDGSINWVNPKKMDSYLTTVDIFTLDFYPPQFESKLIELGYGSASKRVKDSVFYSFYCREVSVEIMETESSEPVEVDIDLFDEFTNDSTPNYSYGYPTDAASIKKGKDLFKTNCKACHKINQDMVGPALKGVTERQSKEWLMNFIAFPFKVIASGDEHAITMFEKFGSEMTSFPTLSNEDKKAILAYIESQPEAHAEHLATESISCGIEPSHIKTIWSRKYQNTLLATKEFEERLTVLYQSCNANLLQLYISNLDKNLYEIDRMVAKQLSGSLKTKFNQFASREDGKVKMDSPTLKALNSYYQRKSRANEQASKKAYKSYWGKQRKRDGIANKKHIIKSRKDNKRIYRNFKKELDINTRYVYKKLGIPYTKIRVRRNGYQFPVTTLGPKNIDAFVINQTVNRETSSFTKNGKTATLTYQKLEVKIENEQQYDFVNVYLTSNTLSSYMKMKKAGNKNYTEKLNDLIEYNLVVIAYKGKQGFISSRKAIKGNQTISLSLEAKPIEEIKKEVHTNSKRIEFKDIKEDVRFNKFLLREQSRKRKNADLRKFENELRTVVFPCLNRGTDDFPITNSHTFKQIE